MYIEPSNSTGTRHAVIIKTIISLSISGKLDEHKREQLNFSAKMSNKAEHIERVASSATPSLLIPSLLSAPPACLAILRRCQTLSLPCLPLPFPLSTQELLVWLATVCFAPPSLPPLTPPPCVETGEVGWGGGMGRLVLMRRCQCQVLVGARGMTRLQAVDTLVFLTRRARRPSRRYPIMAPIRPRKGGVGGVGERWGIGGGERGETTEMDRYRHVLPWWRDEESCIHPGSLALSLRLCRTPAEYLVENVMIAAECRLLFMVLQSGQMSWSMVIQVLVANCICPDKFQYCI